MWAPDLAIDLTAAVMAAALIAYAVLAGADFGGGIWDLLARGPRAAAQRAAISKAMGPVWEANHVWLIFLIVLLFTCFPAAYAALSVAFFVPFHLVLAGIVLRGAAFVFRSHLPHRQGQVNWGAVFGGASVMTPFLLGACLGAVSNGHIRVINGEVQADSMLAWIDPMALMTGALALALCSYVAAVYLTLETNGSLQEDFRLRALQVWLVAGVLSIGTLILTNTEAPRLWLGLTGLPAGLAVAVGIALAVISAVAMWRRHFQLARLTAAGQIVVLLSGWALAQWPYLIYPDVTLALSAAPLATLHFILWTLVPGMGLLLPSLWLLFRVFKGESQANQS